MCDASYPTWKLRHPIFEHGQLSSIPYGEASIAGQTAFDESLARQAELRAQLARGREFHSEAGVDQAYIVLFSSCVKGDYVKVAGPVLVETAGDWGTFWVDEHKAGHFGSGTHCEATHTVLPEAPEGFVPGPIVQLVRREVIG